MKIKVIVKEIKGIAGKRKIMLKNKGRKDTWCLFSHPIRREEKKVIKIKNSLGSDPSILCLKHAEERRFIKAC